MTVFSYQQVLDVVWEEGPMTVMDICKALEPFYPDKSWVHSKVRAAVQTFSLNGKLAVHSVSILDDRKTFSYVATGERFCDLSPDVVAKMIVDRYLPSGMAFDRAQAADDLGISHDVAKEAMSMMSRKGIIVKARKKNPKSSLPTFHLDPRKARLL